VGAGVTASGPLTQRDPLFLSDRSAAHKRESGRWARHTERTLSEESPEGPGPYLERPRPDESLSESPGNSPGPGQSKPRGLSDRQGPLGPAPLAQVSPLAFLCVARGTRVWCLCVRETHLGCAVLRSTVSNVQLPFRAFLYM